MYEGSMGLILQALLAKLPLRSGKVKIAGLGSRFLPIHRFVQKNQCVCLTFMALCVDGFIIHCHALFPFCPTLLTFIFHSSSPLSHLYYQLL